MREEGKTALPIPILSTTRQELDVLPDRGQDFPCPVDDTSADVDWEVDPHSEITGSLGLGQDDLSFALSDII